MAILQESIPLPLTLDQTVAEAWRVCSTGPWATSGRIERAGVLRRLGSALMNQVDELASVESKATGRRVEVVRAEAFTSAAWLGHWADLLELTDNRWRLQAQSTLQAGHRRGVVAIIANFESRAPLGAWTLAPALALGNSVILKPPAVSAESSLLVEATARSVGLPAGVLQVVLGDPSVGAQLAAHRSVQTVVYDDRASKMCGSRPAARQQMPEVSEQRNGAPRPVVSLESWRNR